MCSASKPKVNPTAPPPMSIPTIEDENVASKRRQMRARNAAAFGRESTILGGQPGGPTGQAKTLLGT